MSYHMSYAINKETSSQNNELTFIQSGKCAIMSDFFCC